MVSRYFGDERRRHHQLLLNWRSFYLHIITYPIISAALCVCLSGVLYHVVAVLYCIVSSGFITIAAQRRDHRLKTAAIRSWHRRLLFNSFLPPSLDHITLIFTLARCVCQGVVSSRCSVQFYRSSHPFVSSSSLFATTFNPPALLFLIQAPLRQYSIILPFCFQFRLEVNHPTPCL